MSDYFKYFPKVTYNDRSAVNIMKRTKIVEDIFGDPFVFLPYIVRNDDRPEHIAEFYYGSQEKVWLVYFANNIMDMYGEWPLSSADFEENFKKKYAEKSGTTGYAVLAWGQNETITDNIVYYQNIANTETIINTFTFENGSGFIPVEWRAIRYYEYETIMNDNKRNIYLIDNRFSDKFETDLKAEMNG
jgi:hypothetical protein